MKTTMFGVLLEVNEDQDTALRRLSPQRIEVRIREIFTDTAVLGLDADLQGV